MEWTKEIEKQCLMLKIKFVKASNRVDWSFIFEKLTCLGFGSRCEGMVNTLFTNALAFVFFNKALSPQIVLHWSIQQGLSLSPYLYIRLLMPWVTCWRQRALQGR